MELLGHELSTVERALLALSAIPGFPAEPEAKAAIGLALEAAGLSDSTMAERVQEAVATESRWRGVPGILGPPEDGTSGAYIPWERPADWIRAKPSDAERQGWVTWWEQIKARSYGL